MCDAAGLRPLDRFAYAKMNMGVGQETGLDLTGIPQATYALARSAVEVYDVSKVVVTATTTVASDATIAVAETTVSVASDVVRTVYVTVRDVVNSAEIVTTQSDDGSRVRAGIGWRF
jgi:predicted phage tail protein